MQHQHPLSPVWPTKPTFTWRSSTLVGDSFSLLPYLLSKSSSIQEFPHSSTSLSYPISPSLKCPLHAASCSCSVALTYTATDTFKRLHSVVYLCIQLTFIKRLAGPGLAGLNPGGRFQLPWPCGVKIRKRALRQTLKRGG